jgi:glycerol kinase
MRLIKNASEINTLAAQAKRESSGVYFVTAFSGLLAPYWDPTASGLIIGN